MAKSAKKSSLMSAQAPVEGMSFAKKKPDQRPSDEPSDLKSVRGRPLNSTSLHPPQDQNGLSEDDWQFFKRYRFTLVRELTAAQALRRAKIAKILQANGFFGEALSEADKADRTDHASSLFYVEDKADEVTKAADPRPKPNGFERDEGDNHNFWRMYHRRMVCDLSSAQLARLAGMADRMQAFASEVRKRNALFFEEDEKVAETALVNERKKDNETKIVVVPFDPVGTASDLKKTQKPFEQLVRRELPMRHCDDIVGVRRKLVDEFPYAVDIIDSLLAPSLVQSSVGKTGVVIQPTVIVGPPGLGKTRIARKLCEALGVHYRCISVAGYADDMIFGLSKGWSTATASLMLDLVNESSTPNPVVILDEIEKINPESRNGNIQQKLLPLLEKLEAKAYAEPLLGVPVDFSAVGWIFTANSLDGISQPLRGRLKCYHMTPPAVVHLPKIVDTMRLDLASEQGVDPRWIRGFDRAEMEALTKSYLQHKSVRILLEQVRSLIGARMHSVQ